MADRSKTRAQLIEEVKALRSRLAKLDREKAERKRTEQELRESKARYRSLFENMLDGFAYCKMLFDENNKPVDFVYLEVSEAFERLTGLSTEEVVGKKVTEAIPTTGDTHPELFDIYGKVALTGKGTEFDIYFEPLGIWLSISVYSPQRGYFVAVFDNITARKQAGEKLQEESEFNRESVIRVQSYCHCSRGQRGPGDRFQPGTKTVTWPLASYRRHDVPRLRRQA